MSNYRPIGPWQWKNLLVHYNIFCLLTSLSEIAVAYIGQEDNIIIVTHMNVAQNMCEYKVNYKNLRTNFDDAFEGAIFKILSNSLSVFK